MERIEQSINGTIQKVLTIYCAGECTGRTRHQVLMSVDQLGSENSINWDAHYQILQCQGCSNVSFREAHSSSEDYILDDDGVPEYNVFESLYPYRTKDRQVIRERDRQYLPNNVHNIYEETLQALHSELFILTGIGLRALIETVCKEKNASGMKLFHKIDSLKSKNILTPVEADILHTITTLGNNAAHEAKPHSEIQLSLCMNVVEQMLKNVYILPKQMSEEFNK